MLKAMCEVVAYSLVVSFGFLLVWLFSLIWVNGRYYVQEPNIYILVFESAMSVAIFTFGIVMLVRRIKRGQ